MTIYILSDLISITEILDKKIRRKRCAVTGVLPRRRLHRDDCHKDEQSIDDQIIDDQIISIMKMIVLCALDKFKIKIKITLKETSPAAMTVLFN